MNAKTVFSTALVVTVLSWGAVRGQTPDSFRPMDSASAATGGTVVEVSPAQPPPANFQLSGWIRGDDYGCCGGSCGGPLGYELFMRSGPSLVLGGGTISDVLQTGVSIGGGGRLLFFDPSVTDAWTVELGITNIYNHAHASNNPNGIALNILVPQNTAGATTTLPPILTNYGQNGVPGVSIKDINRTFVDLGGGREWYLWGSAAQKGANWRIGVDGGGRYGSESVDFDIIRHRADTMGGLFAAVHTDFEIPLCGCCVFQAGFRIEYGYIWSEILQDQNNSNTQDLNFLFSVGFRY